MRTLLAALLFATSVAVTPAVAQQTTEQRDVMAALDRFFEGMTKRDTTLSRTVMVPGAVFYANQGGRTFVTSDTSYFGSLAKSKGVMVERIWNPQIMVDGPVAEVWTRYDFHVDGKFSHCGIDSFTMVKGAEGWRMATAVYSIQRDNCEPSPLGPLKSN